MNGWWEPPTVQFECHWFDDCLKCNWEDCVAIYSPHAYNSPAGRRLRGSAFADFMERGISAVDLAQFFAVPLAQVLYEARSVGRVGGTAIGQRAKVIRQKLRAGDLVETFTGWSLSV